MKNSRVSTNILLCVGNDTGCTYTKNTKNKEVIHDLLNRVAASDIK